MKVRLTRTRRGVSAATLALAALLPVSGCAGQNPNTAAVVNGTVISEKDIDAASRDLAALGTSGQSITKQDILLALILRPFVVEAAQRRGTMVSQSEARAALAKEIPDPSPATLDFAQASLVSRRLPQQELTALAQQIGTASVTINPRYGAFDLQRGMVPAPENWLDAAAQPTAAPAAPQAQN